MVKMRSSISLTILFTVILGVWGWSYTDSYTDVTRESNYMDSMLVAEIPEAFAIEDCKNLNEMLPSVEYILSVTPSEEYEQLFGIGHQKVIITGVYSGDELVPGQEIYITTNRWNLFLFEGERSAERGFVNVMKFGAEYLVFGSEVLNFENENTIVLRLYEDSYIAPIFCYDEMTNVIAEVSGNTTYVSYRSVRNNEFFACTEDAIGEWLILKKNMLDLYPMEKNCTERKK